MKENKMTDIIQQGFMVGTTVFRTRAEANDFIRRPKVIAALTKLAKGNKDLIDFLESKEDEIKKAFDTGVVSRVTKSERSRLEKCFEYLKSLNDPKLAFLADNAEAAVASFRWPTVKRLTDAEKASEMMNELTKLANQEAATWIVANRDAIEDAYNAGIEKKEINPKAMEALAAHQAKVKAEKEVEAAEKAKGPEAHAKYLADKKARDEAAKKAKEAAAAAAKAAAAK